MLGIEFGLENCAELIMKCRKRQTVGKIELPNQVNKTLEEKENYNYWWMSEADTIKQREIKKKIKKRTTEEQEIFLEPCSVVEISPKEWTPGQSLLSAAPGHS